MSDQKHKILLVDDDADIHKALGNKISRLGWDISMATDGEEGMKQLKKTKPDLVVLDIRMPRMDGIEMLTELRKKYNAEELPVMVLTNHGTKENVANTISLRAENFLIKADYSLDEIIKKMRELLNNK